MNSQLSLQLPTIIALVLTVWTTGVAFGFFASKYMTKKECEKSQALLWKRLDALQDAMTGKPIRYELRMVDSDV